MQKELQARLPMLAFPCLLLLLLPLRQYLGRVPSRRHRMFVDSFPLLLTRLPACLTLLQAMALNAPSGCSAGPADGDDFFTWQVALY
jgi:hypothetical protein